MLFYVNILLSLNYIVMIINKNEEVKLDTEEIKTHDSPSVEKEGVTSTEDKDNSSDDNNIPNDGEKISEDKDVETLPDSDDTKEEDKEETLVEDEEEKINEIIDKLIEDIKKGDENSEKIVKEILKKDDKVKNFLQIKTNLIIFHPPYIEYNVSKEVMTQYDFLKNAKHILEKNNINLIYFYELLPPERARKYYDIEENFKYSFEELLEPFYNIDLPYLKNKIEKEMHNYLIHFFESGKYLSINGDGKKIFSIYDPHSLNQLKKMENYNVLNLDHHKTNKFVAWDVHLDDLDLIITSSNKYFTNIKSKYQEKTEFIPFSYNPHYTKIFELQDFDNYFNREKKILMSGALAVYTHRKIIVFLKQNIADGRHIYPSSAKDLQDMVVNLDQRKEFSNIIEIMPFRKYNRKNTKYNEERGILYLRTLSKYMGAFMCFADFPLDFHLCKLLEIMLSGCLVFVEPKDILQTDLGLIPYVHYVPMLIDENNKLIIDIEYYNKYLGTEEGFKIAKQGFEYMRDNFTDEKVAEKYCEILKRRNLI